MIKIVSIALVALMIGGTGASAQKLDSLTVCAAFGELAEVVMRNRQSGVGLTEQMRRVPPQEHGPERDVITAIIMGAYDVTRFSTAENQRRAAQEYRDDAELQCLRAMKGMK